MITSALTVFFVADQSRSVKFYRQVLQAEPALDVPGMTEFQLGPHCRLGIMPRAGAERLLGDLPEGCGGELYLYVDEPLNYAARARSAGAEVVSELAVRNWGGETIYLKDQDGHVLAFARTLGNKESGLA